MTVTLRVTVTYNVAGVNMKIAIIGAGYAGLAAGNTLAKKAGAFVARNNKPSRCRADRTSTEADAGTRPSTAAHSLQGSGRAR